MEGLKDRVRFNVGGRIFETTTTTLANAGRDSFFGAMLDDNWNLRPQPTPEHFLDRNPDCFGVVLGLLRTKTLSLPPNVTETLLYKEAQFYGLTTLLRSSKCGPVDGNTLTHSHSITSPASGDGTAIRASPDGGCCTAHGHILRVYDYTLNHRTSPINLDYRPINDALYLDNDNILVSASSRLCQNEQKGGMGVFSSSTSHLIHKFLISHENIHNKSYTAGALSYDGIDRKIFASCKGKSNEYGVGVWDYNTGQEVDFFYGWGFGEADRLQWLDGRKCLLVATMYPRIDKGNVSLLDFRCKRVVLGLGLGLDVRDVIGMEERGTICVVNESGDLGFMDLRGLTNGVRWRHQIGVKSGVDGEVCFPKLVGNGGQLFCSKGDWISVFDGPDWVMTSSVGRGDGRSICDLSIGGDRVFALSSEGNGFDVWESPPTIG